MNAGEKALAGLKDLSVEQLNLIKQTLKVDKLIVVEKLPGGSTNRLVL